MEGSNVTRIIRRRAGSRSTTSSAVARDIAREEVASLCGLVLGRLNADPHEPLAQKLASAFGEALRDFGGTKEAPGDGA